MLRSLRAVHSSRHVFGQSAALPDDVTGLFANADQATQDAVHPVVIRHPLSGRRSICEPGFTTHFDGYVQESAPLLQFLYGISHAPSTLAAFTGNPLWRFGITARLGTWR